MTYQQSTSIREFDHLAHKFEWEEIDEIKVPFLIRLNGEKFAEIKMLQKTLYKSYMDVFDSTIFYLACPIVHMLNPLECHVLNEINKQCNMHFNQADYGYKIHYLLSRAEAIKLYELFKEFFNIITTFETNVTKCGYLKFETSNTPIPFAVSEKYGKVIPVFIFDTPEVYSAGFNLKDDDHWTTVYLTLCCKLLAMKKTLMDKCENMRVIQLEKLLELDPLLKPVFNQPSIEFIERDELLKVKRSSEMEKILEQHWMFKQKELFYSKEIAAYLARKELMGNRDALLKETAKMGTKNLSRASSNKVQQEASTNSLVTETVKVNESILQKEYSTIADKSSDPIVIHQCITIPSNNKDKSENLLVNKITIEQEIEKQNEKFAGADTSLEPTVTPQSPDITLKNKESPEAETTIEHKNETHRLRSILANKSPKIIATNQSTEVSSKNQAILKNVLFAKTDTDTNRVHVANNSPTKNTNIENRSENRKRKSAHHPSDSTSGKRLIKNVRCPPNTLEETIDLTESDDTDQNVCNVTYGSEMRDLNKMMTRSRAKKSNENIKEKSQYLKVRPLSELEQKPENQTINSEFNEVIEVSDDTALCEESSTKRSNKCKIIKVYNKNLGTNGTTLTLPKNVGVDQKSSGNPKILNYQFIRPINRNSVKRQDSSLSTTKNVNNTTNSPCRTNSTIKDKVDANSVFDVTNGPVTRQKSINTISTTPLSKVGKSSYKRENRQKHPIMLRTADSNKQSEVIKKQSTPELFKAKICVTPKEQEKKSEEKISQQIHVYLRPTRDKTKTTDIRTYSKKNTKKPVDSVEKVFINQTSSIPVVHDTEAVINGAEVTDPLDITSTLQSIPDQKELHSQTVPHLRLLTNDQSIGSNITSSKSIPSERLTAKKNDASSKNINGNNTKLQEPVLPEETDIVINIKVKRISEVSNTSPVQSYKVAYVLFEKHKFLCISKSGKSFDNLLISMQEVFMRLFPGVLENKLLPHLINIDIYCLNSSQKAILRKVYKNNNETDVSNDYYFLLNQFRNCYQVVKDVLSKMNK